MIKLNQVGQVLQIKMGREIDGRVPYTSTAYLVDGLLVDTGPAHIAGELAQALDGRRVMLAVNTHYHEDHIGGNALLMRERGIRILASSLSVSLIKQRPKLYPIRELAWGTPEPTEVDSLPERIETDHFRFDVVNTPGHCPGHVALVEPERGWCFCGDLYTPWEPAYYRPSDEELVETVRSMEKLVGLETQELVLFPSVGRVVQDGRAALQSRVQYYRDMACRARRLEEKGLSVAAIRDELLGGETELTEATGGDISAEHLVKALLSADI